MNKRLLNVFAAVSLVASTGFAQQATPNHALGTSAFVKNAKNIGMPSRFTRPNPSEKSMASSFAASTFKGNVLPASISVPGADPMPMSSKFDFQSWGHPLHTIQVDPSNPQHIHACAMIAPANTVTDTVSTSYPSRRVVYTYSADGGKTWSNPVTLGTNARLGYANMVLLKKSNGDYVPIIAAHKGTSNPGDTVNTVIYVEQGAPGAGNFKAVMADRYSKTKADNGEDPKGDFIWPDIALSPDQSKLYVLATSQANTDGSGSITSYNAMEFGSYSIANDGSSVTWNGWNNEVASDFRTDIATAESGIAKMQVASDGRIGVLWRNPDRNTPDYSLYYVESTDQGATWSQPATIFGLGADDGQGNQLAPDLGFDFFFDGTTAKMVYAIDLQQLPNRFYPYSAELLYRTIDLTQQTAVLPTILNGSSSLTFTVSGNETTIDPLYGPDYFVAPATGTLLEPQGRGLITLPTIARTSDPNTWGVFYQTFVDGDTLMTQDIDGNDQSLWYTSIYGQFTHDGGQTWTAPQQIAGNAGSPAQKLDYHFPSVSDWNPIAGAGVNFQMMMLVDTFPGLFSLSRNGSPGWDDNQWFHKSLTVDEVKQVVAPASFTLSQNYPNPFNPSTTINFSLKERSNVVLTVSDMLGRTVATLVNGTLASGDHHVTFNAGSLPSGAYQYTLKSGSETYTRHMILSK